MIFFLNEDIIKENEKLSNKNKISLEKGELIDIENKNNQKLNSLINDCLNIEYDIIKLNDIKQKKYNSLNNSIIFSPEEL